MLCALYLVFLLLSISTIDSTEVLETGNTFKSEMGTSLNDSECTIYMAQSSISGAGFGIFTTRDLLEGEDILPYSDAPNIVVCDHDEMGVENKDWTLPDYFWGASSWGDFECIDGSESVMSFGSLCNFHTVSHYNCLHIETHIDYELIISTCTHQYPDVIKCEGKDLISYV